MSTAPQITDERIETYLNRLNAALEGVAPTDKAEILREIRAHILDSTERATDHEGSVDRVLRLLGTPEELAGRYRTECLLTRAGKSFSPWLLLRTSWRWALLGITGTAAFMLGLFGYGTALALTIAVFLKPIMPSRVGMWLGPRNFQVGVPAHPAAMHEILGQWFIPIMAVAAFALAVGTTHALRWMIRKRASTLAYARPGTMSGAMQA